MKNAECGFRIAELISRQAAIDAMRTLKKEDDEMYGCEIPEGFDGERAVEALESLPAISVKRTAKVKKKGLYTGAIHTGHCGNCGGHVVSTYDRFCHSCGAKLEWETDEEGEQ